MVKGVIYWMTTKPRNGTCRFCFLLAFVVVGGLVVNSFWDKWKLEEILDSWSGFQGERGDYNFTVVTGLFDIGRGSWWTQRRSYNEYLAYLFQILKLDVNLIIFIEPKGQQFVHTIRRGRAKRTEIIIKEVKDLEYFPLLGPITEIMSSQHFQEGNDNYKRGKCEAVVPLYNLVTNSKVTLVHEAIRRNPFKTEYFIWLDGGYGHGDSSLYPQDGVWIPRHLLRYPEKVTFIALNNLSDAITSDVQNLHKLDTALIAGGLFAGGIAAMETFYKLHKSVMDEYITEWKIDDDQTTFADCYFRQPSNFRPVIGSWYDLMKPFI